MLGCEGVGELRVEGMDAGDGDVGVVAPDGAADGFDELGGVLCAADEEVGGLGRIVPVGKVDHVGGRGAEGVVVGVGGYPDDGVVVSAAVELTAYSALARPDGLGGGLGDDCVRLGAVSLIEGAALKDVLLDGGEVIGADPTVIGEYSVAGLVHGVDAIDPVFAGEDQAVTQCGGVDSGQRAEFLEYAVIEADAVFVVGEALRE